MDIRFRGGYYFLIVVYQSDCVDVVCDVTVASLRRHYPDQVIRVRRA